MSGAWAGGSDTRWRRYRAWFLGLPGNNVCKIGDKGCTGTATEVDHIVPLEMGGAKYDVSNCRAACGPCNRGRKRVRLREQPSPRPVSLW